MKNGLLKLGDFGIARLLNTTSDMASTVIGTPYYLSPEIVQSNKYGFATDIWSLGVVLYELCSLRPPFNGQSLHMLAMQIVSGIFEDLPGCYSSELKKLVKCLLTVDETKRPTINELIRLPIIAERAQMLLSDDVFRAEFSHTVLHSHNVFDQLKLNAQEVKNSQQEDVSYQQEEGCASGYVD